MCVEALDAVNVAPDGIDVMTSLGESVNGDRLAEVALMTVCTDAKVENNSDSPGMEMPNPDKSDAMEMTGLVAV